VIVHVVDTLPGVSVLSRKWSFDVPKITLRDLVHERVRRDVEAFNLHRPDVYRGLVQPEDSERILNGYEVKRLRTLDPEREYQQALKAFASNGFLVFVSGRQIDSLDEEIDLETAGQVEFLKLVPLVGG
jgi:hypothetical protein